MSSRTAKFALIMPYADSERRDDYYPRHLVVSGTLAFCLTVWGIVIFAVAQYV